MDLVRQLSVFDPSKLRQENAVIGIAGVGALGSTIALQLAKLGVPKLVLWDDDIVEPHNLCNQVLYGHSDEGYAKVDSASLRLQSLTSNVMVVVKNEKLVDRLQIIETGVTHLFVCVDSMMAREQIFRNCVWLKPNIRWFAEGRMNPRDGLLYAFDPRETGASREYMARMYPDDEVVQQVTACGGTISVGPTAMMLATLLVWRFMLEYDPRPAKEQPDKWQELAWSCDRAEVLHKGVLYQAAYA